MPIVELVEFHDAILEKILMEKSGCSVTIHFSTISVYRELDDLDSYYPCSGVLSILNPYKVCIEGLCDGEGTVGDGVIIGDASTRIVPLAELYGRSVKVDKILIDLVNTSSIRIDICTATLTLEPKD